VPIIFSNHHISYLPKNRSVIREWIVRIIEEAGFQQGEISIVFTNDDYLLDLNKKYLNHDYFTDILTFDYSGECILSGDIFISYDRAVENAKKYNVSLNNEMKRLIIHGILHLCGYSDADTMSKERMRMKEDEGLTLVKDLLII